MGVREQRRRHGGEESAGGEVEGEDGHEEETEGGRQGSKGSHGQGWQEKESDGVREGETEPERARDALDARGITGKRARQDESVERGEEGSNQGREYACHRAAWQ